MEIHTDELKKVTKGCDELLSELKSMHAGMFRTAMSYRVEQIRDWIERNKTFTGKQVRLLNQIKKTIDVLTRRNDARNEAR